MSTIVQAGCVWAADESSVTSRYCLPYLTSAGCAAYTDPWFGATSTWCYCLTDYCNAHLGTVDYTSTVQPPSTPAATHNTSAPSLACYQTYTNGNGSTWHQLQLGCDTCYIVESYYSESRSKCDCTVDLHSLALTVSIVIYTLYCTQLNVHSSTYKSLSKLTSYVHTVRAD